MNKSNKTIITLFIIICLILLVLLVFSKDKIYKIVLVKENPREYIFNTSIDSLNSALTKKFSYMGLSVFTIEDKTIIPKEILDLLLLPNNNQDIFLNSIGIYCKSKTYFKNDKEFLDYWVSFYLHIEKIDEIHTKINIITIEPKIIIGNEMLPSIPHFVRKPKTIIGVPSTIEEYEILIEIGKLIGEKEMPSIILPNVNCKIQHVKL